MEKLNESLSLNSEVDDSHLCGAFMRRDQNLWLRTEKSLLPVAFKSDLKCSKNPDCFSYLR